MFNLEDLSTKADILRGTSTRLASKVLGKRAIASGLNGRQFRSIFTDNFVHFINNMDGLYSGTATWGIALGVDGRNSSLSLENGGLDDSRKNFADLQLIGYLSRLDSVSINFVDVDVNIQSQQANGTNNGVRTSLSLIQYPDQIQATGFRQTMPRGLVL